MLKNLLYQKNKKYVYGHIKRMQTSAECNKELQDCEMEIMTGIVIEGTVHKGSLMQKGDP